ncbi:MAG: hypothetical protein AAF555_11990 [Verrucomicrobiota bacterium]
MKTAVSLMSVFLTALTTASADFRVFRSAEGQVMEAEVLEVTEKSTTMRLQNGQEFTLPLERFSPADQEFLREWSPPGLDGEQIEKLNEVIGHPLFSGSKALWGESAAEIALRLKWPPESETKYSSSFRRYPGPKERFLSSRLYSAVVYAGEDGHPDRFSLVYANKGDFYAAAGSGEDHFAAGQVSDEAGSLEEAMASAEERIAKQLSSILAEGESQRFGEGSTRRTVRRWDFQGHAFLLSHVEQEYVGLTIVPTEQADSSGRSGLTSDQVLRARLERNVLRQENGDVVLANIPMVDQGPKGYCVPATFERAMRYMAIPADMYLLAQAGQSDAGGGTVTSILVDAVKSEVSSKARRVRDLDLERFKLSLIARYIDKGVPILWHMASLDRYNQIANERTVARESISDWSAWAEMVSAEMEANVESGDLHPETNYHICMIVGYNAATEEIAVSDSWGPRYELRWVHLGEAAAVSMGGGYVIDL